MKKVADQLDSAALGRRPEGAHRPPRRAAPLIGLQREKRREEKAKKADESRVRKQELVGEAEKIAAGKDWRNGANRLRQLLDEWKALPRLDKAADEELWHRFSGARTAYTKARKAHFAVLDEQRGAARVVKERLIVKAEELSDSTEWGPTAGAYRELMRQWKAAGPAPKDVDDKLWARFRGAQDKFFGAREAATAEQDKEFEANAEVKLGLLVEAEALLPVKDLDAAKRAFREIADRWDAAGKVPRNQMKDLEARHPQGRAGHPRHRGRQVAPQRPREVRPCRRHDRQARGRHRRDRVRPRRRPRGREREEGQEPRGEPGVASGVPRHGPQGRRRLFLSSLGACAEAWRGGQCASG